VIAVIPQWKLVSQRAASLSNMRQVGMGFQLYAGEHDYALPGRTTGTMDRWPRLLLPYLNNDPRVYAQPGDPNNYISRGVDPLYNQGNNTSYIMNGYNDAGALNDPSFVPRINLVQRPGQLILLGTPNGGSRHYYMDMLEGAVGNHISVLNLEAYNGGANYLFADGSARFLKKSDYDARMWLINSEFVVP